MVKFVLNDEKVANTYGFFISTEGIDLSRFSQNPVMLSDHWNNNEYVLGNWLNIEKVDGQLLAEPNFDTEDDKANKIAGKVNRGFLKGCSMGIILDRENLSYVDGKIFLTRCELAEASIVPVPSNKNAVRLYNTEGELMKEDDIKSLCLSITEEQKPNENFNQNHTMKKVMLSLAAMVALGYDTKSFPKEGVEESEIDAKVVELAGKVETLTKKNEALELAAKTAKDAQEAEKKTRVTTKVKLAVTQGKIGADKEQQFVDLGMASEDVLETTLGSIPEKKNFSAGLNTPGGTGTGSEVKSMDDFQKLSHEAQLSFKNDNPEEYKKLFSNQ